MREVLERHLPSLDGKRYQVRECGVSFTRHREAFRCLLQYTLRLLDPTTGREWSQVVSGVMYGAERTRQVWEAVEAQWQASRGHPASFPFAPFSYVPDLDLLLQVFPYDHRLPALPRLLAGPPPELAPQLLARFGRGDWEIEVWDAESVRYRVGMRAMVRVKARARDAATGRALERRFYAKVYDLEEEGEHTFQAHQQLWDEAATGGMGVAVARPVVYLGDLRALVQEEVAGTPLANLLRREGEAIPAVREAARAVASLHLCGVVPPRRRHLRDELARLENRAALLRSAHPRLGPEIGETVAAVVAGLEDVPPAPTHGDLKPGHILLDGDRVALLDLDKFAAADPVLDVANLLVHLVKTRPRARRPDADPATVTRAFAEEYFARVPAAWRARLPLHYAMALLNKAASSLRGQERGGPDGVEAMLQEAKDALVGRRW